MEQTLGKRIVSQRKRLGLTQDQLAEQLGITAQAVSKWENDQSCPDITILPKLAQIFGITVDQLLGVEVPPAQQEVPKKSADRHTAKGNFELQWNAPRKDSLMLAILVLLVGGLLLAGNILSWDISFWGILWPSALLVYGLSELYPRFRFLHLNCVLLGGYALANKLELLPPMLRKDTVFPLLLLLLGLSLLVNAFRRPKRSRQSHQNHSSTFQPLPDGFHCEVHFGEDHRCIHLPLLSKGDINCSFGELTVDLSGCEKISIDCHLQANCSFGELTILMPRRFRAELISETAFANVNMIGHAADDALPLSVNCNASFGEISIRYI